MILTSKEQFGLAWFLSSFVRLGTGPTGDCMEWSGNTTTAGYGLIRPRLYGEILAHRLSFLACHGTTADGFVCHTCDNPPCILPRHLYLGDALTNARDSWARGRHRRQYYCHRGHEWRPDTTYVDPRGWKQCRLCISMLKELNGFAEISS
jgi:hypothetical protein